MSVRGAPHPLLYVELVEVQALLGNCTMLNRLNTFGDELFGDDKVLRSYYYAITDFTVGGRSVRNNFINYQSLNK